MSADREHWQRVREILEHAADLTGEERALYLEGACDGDDDLLREVHELLRAAEGAPTSFMEPPDVEWDAAEEDVSGRRVGDFELMAVLGRGGMGTVYRARQVGLDREVAVKIVRHQVLGDEAHAERFHREARAAARLDHPAIARVIVEGSTSEYAWFAMELVSGHTLATEIMNHCSTVEDASTPKPKRLIPGLSTADLPQAAARVMVTVADALAHSHSEGVVHRDIKPSNLMVTPDGEIKIVDFGVARDEQLGTITRSGQLIGSLLYMSPEQARVVRRPVDERTDVYSAGVVLYELLTRRRPFEGDTTHDVLTKIRQAMPERVRACNANVPRDLAVICEMAMARDLGDRYSSAGLLRDDLGRFLNGESVTARPVARTKRLFRWAKRHVAVLGSIALLSMFGLATWGLTRDQSTGPRATLVVEGAGGAQVGIQWLDTRTHQPGPKMELSGDLVEGLTVNAGYVRVTVSSGADEPDQEFSRQLFADQNTRVRVPTLSAALRRTRLDGMALVDGGSFQAEGPGVSPFLEQPVAVAAFYLDQEEVSVGDYRQFLASKPNVAPPRAWGAFDANRLTDDLPMSLVTWEEARAYAEWAGKRLPTHAEWMWAARGKELRERPWDPAPGWLGATTGPLFQTDVDGYAGAVDQFLANVQPTRSSPEAAAPGGLLHLLGNVSEWTESPLYYTRGENPHVLDHVRVVCGCYWACEQYTRDLKHFDLKQVGPDGASILIGFRCALSAN